MELVELTPASILLIVIAIIVASVISGVTGMAGGVLMFAAMNVFIPLRPLIAIHGAVQIFNNAARSWYLRQHLLWSFCGPFALGAVLGALATTLVIAEYAGELVPLILLAALIFYTLFKPKHLPPLKVKPKNFVWVGVATGSMGIIAGAIDPLLAAFFLRDDMSKEEIVANKSMMQLVTHLTKIPAFLYLGFSFVDNFFLIALFSASAVLGTYFGIKLLNKIDRALFMRLMWWALFIAGLRVIYQLSEKLIAF